jgi:inosose dehydratase
MKSGGARRSRRAFLAGAAAVPFAPSVLEAKTPQGPRGKAHPLKVGLASYSVRKLPFDEVLAFCQEADIAYINFKDVHLPMTDSAEALAAKRQKVEAAGLTIMGGGTITLKDDPTQLRAAFEYARRAGFPLMVAAPEPPALDKIEALIKEFGIKVAIHNHGPEDKYWKAPQDAYRQLKGRDPRFGLCMDIGHTTRAGVDPVATVDEVKDRLLDLHLKDLKVKTDEHSQTEVGKGALDLPGLLRALAKISFAGHCGLEYEIHEEAPQAGIRESLAYLRGVLDTLSA